MGTKNYEFMDSSLMQWFFVTTVHRSKEVIGCLLTFCESTFGSLVIDVYTRYLIEDKCIKTSFMN